MAECMFNLERMAPEPGEARVFDAPPEFVFELRASGWAHMAIVGFCSGKAVQAPVWLSAVEPPFESLWLWSFLIALGVSPLWVRVDEEDSDSWFGAHRRSDGKLLLRLG